jgi:hypothetical protein
MVKLFFLHWLQMNSIEICDFLSGLSTMAWAFVKTVTAKG